MYNPEGALLADTLALRVKSGTTDLIKFLDVLLFDGLGTRDQIFAE